MDRPADVKVTVVEQDVHAHGPIPFGSIWEEGSLKQLIDALRAIYKTVPKEFRPNAYAEITSRGSHDGAHHAVVTIGYHRPETAEEAARRHQTAKQTATAEEARAREQYAILKARFEGSPPQEQPSRAPRRKRLSRTGN